MSPISPEKPAALPQEQPRGGEQLLPSVPPQQAGGSGGTLTSAADMKMRNLALQ